MSLDNITNDREPRWFEWLALFALVGIFELAACARQVWWFKRKPRPSTR